MCIGKYFAFVCSIHIREEKGEIFRKSLCCVPCSDSESDGVGSDDGENHKTVEQGKIERSSDNESSRKRKKESRKKVLNSQ